MTTNILKKGSSIGDSVSEWKLGDALMDPCLLDSCSAKHVMFWLRKDFLKISDIIKTILFFNSIRHISYIKKKVLEEFSLAPERLQNWKAINLKCKQHLKASLSIIAEVCWAWYLEKIHLMWRKWEWFPASPQLLRCHWKFFIKKKKKQQPKYYYYIVT